jgi:UDP-N-acetylmuramate--alanine ligase
MGEMPPGLEHDYPLARLTTIRTGGRAELFARVGTLAALERVLAWAAAEGVEVGVVGSGSNLLIADEGVCGLVVKLDQDLSKIELRDTRVHVGGGARLPAVSAKAAQAGLTGLEFGVNIPGSVGGAVKGTLAEMRTKRRAAQPSGIKTFGSTFKNPTDPRAEGHTAGQLLEAAGCRGLQIGGARFSAKHANFVENHGDASTADVIALMATGRRRVKEKFGVELEPEVQALGPVHFPAESGRG